MYSIAFNDICIYISKEMFFLPLTSSDIILNLKENRIQLFTKIFNYKKYNRVIKEAYCK